MTAFELEILNALRIAGNDVSVAEIISRAKIARARANVSSRLCELRTKELCTSRQHDGINYWSLTAKGREALGLESPVNAPEMPDIAPDIADPETPLEPVADQPVKVDISVDISVNKEAQRIADIQSGKTPTYSLSDALNSLGIDPNAVLNAKLVADQPVEADISEDDIPRFAYEREPDGDDDISPELIEESRRVRPAAQPLDNLPDALFVLDTLALTYCVDMPAYQQELGRIARYLREAA